MPEQEREAILQENLRAVGMAIIETGMAWFWSDARIKKWSKVEGLNYLKENAQDGIIFVGVHFLTLELGARIVGLHHPWRRRLSSKMIILYWIGYKSKVAYVQIKIC